MFYFPLFAGFDPCVVSQQGLADLLETEAEQKQQQQQQQKLGYHRQYHQYGNSQQQQQHLSHGEPSHSSREQLSNPTRTSFSFRKGFPNGIISHPDEEKRTQQNWKGHNSVSHSRLDSDLLGSSASSSSMNSLKDEFKALFPTVNISFGGTLQSACQFVLVSWCVCECV